MELENILKKYPNEATQFSLITEYSDIVGYDKSALAEAILTGHLETAKLLLGSIPNRAKEALDIAYDEVDKYIHQDLGVIHDHTNHPSLQLIDTLDKFLKNPLSINSDNRSSNSSSNSGTAEIKTIGGEGWKPIKKEKEREKEIGINPGGVPSNLSLSTWWPHSSFNPHSSSSLVSTIIPPSTPATGATNSDHTEPGSQPGSNPSTGSFNNSRGGPQGTS
jgi:hypothetical protein